MKPWARRLSGGVAILLLVASALVYFLAGLVVPSGIVPFLWLLWAVVASAAMIWRRRPLLLLATPVIAVAILFIVIVVSGHVFGRGS